MMKYELNTILPLSVRSITVELKNGKKTVIEVNKNNQHSGVITTGDTVIIDGKTVSVLVVQMDKNHF